MEPVPAVQCQDFPCSDVRHARFTSPPFHPDPARVRLVMVAEAASPAPQDDFYAGPEALFLKTTLLAFQDAGAPAASLGDLLSMGVYLTTAVKCAKSGPGLCAATLEACSHLLEQELARFPDVQIYLLMGDAAIKSFNALSKRAGEGRVIPAGPTYKIRVGEFFYRGRRVFPSYLQAGPAFFIEKSKRQMIAQDIGQALRLLN